MAAHFQSLCLSLALLATGLSVQAQDSESMAPGLPGSWQGSLTIGRDAFDMVFSITVENGQYQAALISRQMGIYGMPAESVELANNRITIKLEILAAEYTGRIRLDEAGEHVSYIDGEWFQEGEMVPVILRPAE